MTEPQSLVLFQIEMASDFGVAGIRNKTLLLNYPAQAVVVVRRAPRIASGSGYNLMLMHFSCV